MDESFRLSADEHKSIFAEVIEPAYFLTSSTVANPKAVIIAGQPGAGKTRVLEVTKSEFPDNNTVIVNTDDLRSFHPKYKDVVSIDDRRAAERTHLDASEWRQQLLDRSMETKRNIILEGVFKNSEQLTKIIQKMKDHGYDVTVRFVAVHERYSFWGIHKRYEKEKIVRGHGRFVPMEYHQECYQQLPNSAEKVEQQGMANRVEVFSRNGTQLFSNIMTDGKWSKSIGARAAIEAERNRKLEQSELDEYTESWNRVFEYMKDRKAPSKEIHEIKKMVSQLISQVDRS
ncbi:MAG: zeta toxin family protein [Cyanobacteria bacterium TGS_CYA1]|nr:zeta toxin family protein [Cyanobacteria bacterium TGS_CYA1]